jgi:hypothetical protein
MSQQKLKKKALALAIEELKSLILARFPDATFEIFEGDDPHGTYLRVMLDLDEVYDVIDVFISRLTDFQVEDDLDLFVEITRPRTPDTAGAVPTR